MNLNENKSNLDDEVIILDDDDELNEVNKATKQSVIGTKLVGGVESKNKMRDSIFNSSKRRMAAAIAVTSLLFNYGDDDENDETYFFDQTRLWNLEEKLALTKAYTSDYVKIYENATGNILIEVLFFSRLLF